MEQDTGMPTWERFKELCHLQFGPPVRDSRLAELGRLQFRTTVQEFTEWFNAALCHARNLDAIQKAELFVGGLPEHIHVDVALRAPHDLHTMVYLARAFELRANNLMVQFPTGPQRVARQQQRVTQAPTASSGAPRSAATALPPIRQFCRLTPAEQQEHRHQGPCFNCDEPYVSAHQCTRLFYLESSDFDMEEDGAVDAAPNDKLDDDLPPQDVTVATACVVSLHAFAGIRTKNTMIMPVVLKGARILALDTGSTHNFLQGVAMTRLGLTPLDGDQLRVTVANGDHLRCAGIARHVPISIAGDECTITCVGIDLGCFDFILGVDFLRTLGDITWNLETMTLAFQRDARRIVWNGVQGKEATCTTPPRRPWQWPSRISHC
jgi:hypothetical protein